MRRPTDLHAHKIGGMGRRPWSSYAPADLVTCFLMIDGRLAATSRRGRKRPGAASGDARRPGSPAPMSTILVRLEAPETRRTALRRTPNESATAVSASSVALPSTARALTRTIRAPSCSPPTPGRAEPGFTRMVIRMQTVSTADPGQVGCGVVSLSHRPTAQRARSAVRRGRGPLGERQLSRAEQAD